MQGFARSSGKGARVWPWKVPGHAALTIAVLVVGLLPRCWLASILTLSKDEALYWAWSLRLDDSYALVPVGAIRLSCALLGATEWAIRLPFLLAMTGAGRYSLDNALDISLDEWVGTVIGLGGALGGAALLAVSWRPAKG